LSDICRTLDPRLRYLQARLRGLDDRALHGRENAFLLFLVLVHVPSPLCRFEILASFIAELDACVLIAHSNISREALETWGTPLACELVQRDRDTRGALLRQRAPAREQQPLGAGDREEYLARRTLSISRPRRRLSAQAGKCWASRSVVDIRL
jgi:hypothetical protein